MTGRIRRQYIWVTGVAIATLGIAVGCHKGVSASEQAQQQAQQVQDQGADPADANMAPVDGSVAQQGTVNGSQTQPTSTANMARRRAGRADRTARSLNLRLSARRHRNAQPYDPNAQGTDQDAGQPVL